MSAPMTSEECLRAMEGLSVRVEGYAELIVRRGCALHPGQELVLQAPSSARTSHAWSFPRLMPQARGM